MAGDFGVPAVNQNFGARSFTFADQRFDTGFALRRDDGTHLDAGLGAVADAKFRSGVGYGFAEGFLRVADSDGNGNGETTPTGAGEGAVADDAGGHVNVGV